MTLASKITLIRVGFIPFYMIFMYLSAGKPNIWMWLALVVFIIASITDYIDGQIARKQNQVSDFGKFLDPLADKLMYITVMLGLVISGPLNFWFFFIYALKELTMIVGAVFMVKGIKDSQ